ncbi:MAG: B12-binding domain-containing radical SAM protein [Lachnospiraceae bacterium]|nr:B12-binding domain-containing radical SAM protein [Lachnospiraceae bacterium]
MKTVLVGINSKYIHSNPAVYSLAASCEGIDADVEVKEFTINRTTDETVAGLFDAHADIYAFSCYIWNIETVRDVISDLHKILPDALIWVGGPEVSYRAKEVLKEFPEISVVLMGEGEVTFPKLVSEFAALPQFNDMPVSSDKSEGIVFSKCDDKLKQLSETVKGICVRTSDGAILPENPSFPELVSMDSIPFWYSDDEGNLRPEFANRILYYESSRGCPYRCSYCLSSVDKTVRFVSMEKVFASLDFFLRNKVKQVKFIDRTFNCNAVRTTQIWEYISKHDNGVTNFHFEIAGELLSDEDIGLLKSMRPGLVQLEIGVQSTNPETLEAINRKSNIKDLRNKVLSLRENGNIHLHTDLIAGLPYEDFESFKRSFNEVYSFGGHDLQLGFLKVLSGSPMERDAQTHDIRFSDRPPYEVLSTKYISYAEIRRLKAVEEMLETYHNSLQFTNTVEFLVPLFETPFAFYETLADFFSLNGFDVNTPSRTERYSMLLKFTESYRPEVLPVVKELLVYDLYLRENLKSRPQFSPLSEQDGGSVYDFYRDEAKIRLFLSGYDKYDTRQIMRMTHLEYFEFPVWDSAKLAKCGQSCGVKKYSVLFDYSERNPVDFSVRTVVFADM